MPDNDVFAEPGTEAAQAPEAKAPEGGIDQSALERALSRTVAPAFQQLNERVGQLAQRVERGQAPPADARAPAAEPPTDDYTHLINNPREFIAKTAADTVGRQVGPAVVQLIESTRETLLAREQQLIDGEYGEGYFAKEIRPKLDIALKEVPLPRHADEKILGATVAAILGMQLRDPEAAQEMNRRRTETTAKRQAATTLGPGRARPSGGGPARATAEENEFVARLARNGVDISLGEYLKDRETPGTLSAWTTRLASEKKS